MAIHWGPARESGTNGARLGIDLTYSVSGSTATVVFELWLWTKRASFGSSASYSRGGSFGSGSGSFSYNHGSNSSDWPTANRTRIGRWTTTRTLEYGATQSVSATGSVSGLGGSIPEPVTHSRSITLPERAVGAPAAPSNVTVARSSDTRTNVGWTRNPSSSAPYEQQQVQRRHMEADRTWSVWYTRATVSGTATAYADTTTSNRRYQYRVRAGNDGGWSDYANLVGEFDTTPREPTETSVLPTGLGIQVRWNHNPWFPASTRIERQENGGAWQLATVRGDGWEEWTHQDPDPAVTHRYRLRAEGQGTPALASSWTYTSTVAIAAPPAAPTGLGPAGAFDATQAQELTWLHVPTDGSEQTAYEVRRRVQGESSWTVTGKRSSSEQGYDLPAGTYENGQTIEWQVRTWGTHPDPGPFSASQFTPTQAAPTVAIDIPVQGEVVDRSSVGVRWGFSQEQGLPQTGWRVELRRDGVVEQAQSGAHATVNIAQFYSLQNNATYTAAVQVKAGDAWSAWDTVTFTTEFVAPPTPVIDVTWDVELGAAVVQIDVAPWTTDQAEPDHVELWRAIGEGAWTLIADDVPLNTAIIDPIPAIGDGTINYYRAVTVSTLPSTADSAVTPLTVTRRDTRGWVYLNAGGSMTEVCRVKAAAWRRGTTGLVKEVRQYADRVRPVEHAGTVRERAWTVSALIAPNVHGASTLGELEALQATPGAVCYRDPTGVRWFASMGQVGDSWRGHTGDVSWPMTEIDYVEGLTSGGESQ